MFSVLDLDEGMPIPKGDSRMVLVDADSKWVDFFGFLASC